VQQSTREERQAFFSQVRMCRRRPLRDWRQSPVARVLQTSDEYHHLEFLAILSTIRERMKAHGLRVFDAFRAFDFDRDGQLSCSELWGGLEFLGIKVSPDDVYAIVRYVDQTGDGRIRFSDFSLVFSDENEDDTVEPNASPAPTIQADITQIRPKPMDELYVDAHLEQTRTRLALSFQELENIRVRVKSVDSWVHVWNSGYTGARKEASVWRARWDPSILKRNAVEIQLGHYSSEGIGRPRANRPPNALGKEAMVLELTDPGVSALSKSPRLDDAHLNALLPHPAKMKLAWSKCSGSVKVYIWKGVPPTENFRSLGMVCTTSPTPPRLDCMRCVPVAWCAAAAAEPKLIWDDTGTGGKRGSFWSVNALGLLIATEGHEPPHPASAGSAAGSEKGGSNSFADMPTEPFSASLGFTEKTWVSAIAALKMHDMSHSKGMVGAEDLLVDSGTSNGNSANSGATRQVTQIPQTKDGWLEIETARGTWRRLRFNLDSNGKITCWHDKPDDRVPFPPRFEVRELKNPRAGKHAFRLEFANPVMIESQIFPSHRKVSKIALAAPSDEEKEIWMCVLGMAGRMLPENHVNAKLSAAIRAEDAAKERRALAEPPAASRANGLAIVETLNKVASASAPANTSIAGKATQQQAPSKQGNRGSLPSTGPCSSLASNSGPPARQLPSQPTQDAQKASAGGSSANGKAGNKSQIGNKVEPAAEPKMVLPPGWTAHKDPDTNLNYYYHAVSGASSWEIPKGAETSSDADAFEDCKEVEKGGAAPAESTTTSREIGGGWTEHFDPDSGIPYFYHAATGRSRWDRPDV
jgi:hypothetical protein